MEQVMTLREVSGCLLMVSTEQQGNVVVAHRFCDLYLFLPLWIIGSWYRLILVLMSHGEKKMPARRDSTQKKRLGSWVSGWLLWEGKVAECTMHCFVRLGNPWGTTRRIAFPPWHLCFLNGLCRLLKLLLFNLLPPSMKEANNRTISLGYC